MLIARVLITLQQENISFKYHVIFGHSNLKRIATRFAMQRPSPSLTFPYVSIKRSIKNNRILHACLIFLISMYINTFHSELFFYVFTCLSHLSLIPIYANIYLSHFHHTNICKCLPASFSRYQYMYILACLIFLAAIHVHTILSHFPGSNTCKYYPVLFSWQQYM